MTIHLLKAWPSFFRAMADGHKKVDVRKNDRDFAVADYLIQYEYTPPDGRVSGQILVQQVTHILTGNGVQEGYVAMSVTELTKKEAARVAAEYFKQNADVPTALLEKLCANDRYARELMQMSFRTPMGVKCAKHGTAAESDEPCWQCEREAGSNAEDSHFLHGKGNRGS